MSNTRKRGEQALINRSHLKHATHVASRPGPTSHKLTSGWLMVDGTVQFTRDGERDTHIQMKKRSERRKHCALAVVRRSQKNFAPPPPFPEARNGQNLISWRCHYLYLQTDFGDDRCSQFRVIMVTDPQTNNQTKQTQPQTHKQTGPITIHWAAKLSAQCN